MLLFAGLLIGLVLWTLGRKIARPVCAVSGLVTAASAIAIAVRNVENPTWQLGLVVAGGVLGCVVAYLLFRLWMGITSAALLALVLPTLVLIWFEPSVQRDPNEVEQLMVDTDSGEHEPREIEASQDEDKDKNEDKDESDAEAGAELFAWLEPLVQSVGDELRAWWDGIEPATARIFLLTAGIGALIGLLAGLIFPYMAASIESALVGTLLVGGCGLLLAGIYANVDADLATRNPKTLAAVVGLITVVGVVLQWMVFRRKADA